MDLNLRITGPTPVPERVARAQTAPMVSHRSAEFRRTTRAVVDRLRPLFGTSTATVMPFTCSGTGGLETAVVNCVAPGDRVLAVSIGYFGERFADIARAYGADVHVHRVGWGAAADPAELVPVLRAGPWRAVLMTHNETSTGVLNPLPQLAAAVREHTGALLLVDGVSSIGGCEFRFDDWGIDVAVTVTQKALMSPPGLAVLAASPRALRAAATGGAPRYYFDFGRMAAAVAEGTTTYTPAISVVHALDAALTAIHEEGWPAVVDRHRRLRDGLRGALVDAGLTPVAPAAIASPTLTAVRLPGGVSASDVRGRLRARHGIEVAAGRDRWRASVVRIGHMGAVTAEELNATVSALTAELEG